MIDSVFGLPGGMALAPWPLWQSNSTKNTCFPESSPESSPVQNPGPVQGIVLPAQTVGTRPLFLSRMHMRVKKGLGTRLQVPHACRITIMVGTG